MKLVAVVGLCLSTAGAFAQSVGDGGTTCDCSTQQEERDRLARSLSRERQLRTEAEAARGRAVAAADRCETERRRAFATAEDELMRKEAAIREAVVAKENALALVRRTQEERDEARSRLKVAETERDLAVSQLDRFLKSEARVGYVCVNTERAGLPVYVDYVYRGNTPKPISVEPGRRTVYVVLQGGKKTPSQSVEVRKGRLNLLSF